MGLGGGKQLQTWYAKQDQSLDQKPGLHKVKNARVGDIKQFMMTLPDAACVEFGTRVWENSRINSNYSLDLSLPGSRIMYLSIL